MDNKSKFEYHLDFISVASFYFYGVGFGLPLVLFILMRFLFGVQISLITNICIYGYSFTILLPIIVLCLIPVELVKIIFLGYGFITSTMFLVYNMYKSIEEKAEKSKYVILTLIVGFQIVLYLTLKLYFFGQIKATTSGDALNGGNTSMDINN